MTVCQAAVFIRSESEFSISFCRACHACRGLLHCGQIVTLRSHALGTENSQLDPLLWASCCRASSAGLSRNRRGSYAVSTRAVASQSRWNASFVCVPAYTSIHSAVARARAPASDHRVPVDSFLYRLRGTRAANQLAVRNLEPEAPKMA